MSETTALFLGTLDRLTDDDLAGPSALPGWTRGHVVAHVHYNALALGRLVSWAATGVENPMYPSREHRDAEIEQGARLPATELRALAQASAADLAAALDTLSPESWERTVVTTSGRSVPASELPWMRAKEAGIHAVDLDAGVTFADLPAGVVAALVPEAAAKHAAGPSGPALAAWLTGRTPEAPQLGPWL
jgi:maleylpyruvate isomerase